MPASIREAGFGVGATRWEVIRSHVLPYAAPGILTGVILTLARAFGETAPLLLVGAAATGFAQPASATVIDRLVGPYTVAADDHLQLVAPAATRRSATSRQRPSWSSSWSSCIVNAFAIILRNRYATEVVT